MIRTRTFRALAGVLGVWVGICLVQPMQLHLCVMHGGLAVEYIGHADSHVAHGAVSHHAHHSTQSHDKSQQCSCLGDCTTGNAPAFVATAQIAAPLPAVDRVVASSAEASRPIVATDFVLPFSNGPPGISSFAS